MASINTYPLITTRSLGATRDFYLTHFGMTIVFEARWVAMLSDRDDGTISLGLMSEDHPSSPPGPEPFDGRGMIITVQVADASEAHDRLSRMGAPITYGLTDEPWGQRRFMTSDPSGTSVDVVEQTEPAPGFWEQYALG
jgi:uncharacterized glyoxalase superfamily protein PhnB